MSSRFVTKIYESKATIADFEEDLLLDDAADVGFAPQEELPPKVRYALPAGAALFGSLLGNYFLFKYIY